jgi:hypothetical protein
LATQALVRERLAITVLPSAESRDACRARLDRIVASCT